MVEKEYIDRRIVLKPFSRRISELSDEPIIIGINEALSRAEGFVKSLPAADVVEVVRCKDCNFYDGITCGYCHKFDFAIKADDFCSYGERRADND